MLLVGCLQWRWLFPAPCTLQSRELRDEGRKLQLRLASGTLTLHVERRLQAGSDALLDTIALHNIGHERLPLSVELNLTHTAAVTDVTMNRIDFAGGSRLTLDPLAAARPDGADWELSLGIGERIALQAHWQLSTPRSS